MSLRAKILGTACAVALGAMCTPALADFAGTLQGNYSNIDISGGGGNVNDWSVAGSGAFGLGMSGLKVEVDGGYNNASENGGGSLTDWNIDGALIWQCAQGRIGASVGYNDIQFEHSGSGNATNYGGFGEWFASPMFTVGVKGGGISDNDHSGGSADYFGGEVVLYAMPDLAFNGTIDYFSLGGGGSSDNITNYGITAEWLVSETTPISVYGGYTYTDISHGGSANTWLVGVKVYTNSNGASTLVDRQRSGVASWGTSVNLIDTVL